MVQGESFSALDITNFPIDDHCVGSKWTVDNEDQLVRLIAIVVMGQALKAAHIIGELLPATPAFTNDALQVEAIKKFTRHY